MMMVALIVSVLTTAILRRQGAQPAQLLSLTV